jgi:hypothetical protein
MGMSGMVVRLAGLVGWVVWGGLFAAWTVGLLVPDPRAATGVHLSPEADFTVSKLCHLLLYGALSATLVWLPCGPGWRCGLLVTLLAHGCGTEFLQLFIPGRHGSLRDVLLDHLGVTLGWLSWPALALVPSLIRGQWEPTLEQPAEWAGEPASARAADQPQTG